MFDGSGGESCWARHDLRSCRLPAVLSHVPSHVVDGTGASRSRLTLRADDAFEQGESYRSRTGHDMRRPGTSRPSELHRGGRGPQFAAAADFVDHRTSTMVMVCARFVTIPRNGFVIETNSSRRGVRLATTRLYRKTTYAELATTARRTLT